jgi:hypothetical protein
MKPDQQIIGTAVRIEVEESTGRLFLVFEIKDEKHKKDIKSNWTDDLEYRLIERNLVKNE